MERRNLLSGALAALLALLFGKQESKAIQTPDVRGSEAWRAGFDEATVGEMCRELLFLANLGFSYAREIGIKASNLEVCTEIARSCRTRVGYDTEKATRLLVKGPSKYLADGIIVRLEVCKHAGDTVNGKCQRCGYDFNAKRVKDPYYEEMAAEISAIRARG
jgi:hypothetical protein